jgi:hypothetical protein
MLCLVALPGTTLLGAVDSRALGSARRGVLCCGVFADMGVAATFSASGERVRASVWVLACSFFRRAGVAMAFLTLSLP